MTEPFCADCGEKAVLKKGELCNDCIAKKGEKRLIEDITKASGRKAEKQSARNRKDFRKNPGGKKK